MKSKSKYLVTVFEHQSLRIGDTLGDFIFSLELLQMMQSYYGQEGVPYYSLVHNGVRFCEYVGIIQVGSIIIEILPKTDKSSDKSMWRNMLIGMLRAVGDLTVHTPNSSSLKIKPNSILDLYFELLIEQIEHLLRAGLVKKYRKVDRQVSALKGNILFGRDIQFNLVHKERFFARTTTYDKDHLLHKILYQALILVGRLNSNTALQSRLGVLMLDFPEQAPIMVNEDTFAKLVFDRKTEAYKNAIEISRLLLLNYHPNVSYGRNHILALMFDMNLLWERFVYVSVHGYFKKHHPKTVVKSNSTKFFWKPEHGRNTFLKPDIVINEGAEDCLVLDTKWKNLNGYNPSPEDLRQLYAYANIYCAKRVALIYPGSFKGIGGTYYIPGDILGTMECSVMAISVATCINDWKTDIGFRIDNWVLDK